MSYAAISILVRMTINLAYPVVHRACCFCTEKRGAKDGPLKRTQNDKIPKGRVPNFWGHVLGRKKSPCGVTPSS